MSNTIKNPPIETHRDGAVSAKVWRNITRDGNPSYSVTFQRTYTNPATNQIAESRSFGSTDILKVSQLASEAYRTIGQMRAMDKADRSQNQAPQQEVAQAPQPVQQPASAPQQGLAQQRDAAMTEAQPTQTQAQTHVPQYDPSPER